MLYLVGRLSPETKWSKLKAPSLFNILPYLFPVFNLSWNLLMFCNSPRFPFDSLYFFTLLHISSQFSCIPAGFNCRFQWRRISAFFHMFTFPPHISRSLAAINGHVQALLITPGLHSFHWHDIWWVRSLAELWPESFNLQDNVKEIDKNNSPATAPLNCQPS